MSYYAYFEREYQEELNGIAGRRGALIDRAQVFTPENLPELLAESEDGGYERELNWTSIPDPRNNGRYLTVRPVLWFTAGSRPDARQKDRYDAGLSLITLDAQTPDGDIQEIGTMGLFYVDGKLKYTPSLSINVSPHPDEPGMSSTEWQSADAELWLRAAESAFDAQF